MNYDFNNPAYTKHASYIKSVFSNVNLGNLLIKKYEHIDGNRRSGIYMIYNSITGDYYIGSAEDLHRRKRSHEYVYKGGKGGNILISRHSKKYGASVFKFLIIHEVPEINLTEAEQFWIKSLDPFYNLTKRAIRRKMTEIGKAKIGEHAKNRRDNSIYKVPVMQYSIDGNFLREWPSIKEATIGVGAYGGHISVACRTGKIVYGYSWKYKNGMTNRRPRFKK